MRIILSGAGGAMGRTTIATVKNHPEHVIVAGVDKFADPSSFDFPVYDSFAKVTEKADCIIDFSVKAALKGILEYAVKNDVPVALCTTGYDSDDTAAIKAAAAKVPVLMSGNMSLGVNTLIKLVKEAAKALSGADIEIIEQHHHNKADAPSGTAKMLLNAAKEIRGELTPVYGREGIVGKRRPEEIGVHAVRGGSIVGKHEVMFILNNEIVTLKHEAESKAVFSEGALRAAAFLTSSPAGLYSMSDVLK